MGQIPAVKVKITNVTKKIVRGKNIRFENDDHRWVFFKYKRLPNFCYICGKLGHGGKECKESGLPNGGKGEVAYQYGAWLRGEPGKQVLNNSDHHGNNNFDHPSRPSEFKQNHWMQ